jgi:hypothetical protein
MTWEASDVSCLGIFNLSQCQDLVAAFSFVFFGWVIVLVLKMYNSQVGHTCACAIAVSLCTANKGQQTFL